MSMLAERRQKQKWSLNPQGKWWSEDSNKFGQKMLEKMGWTKGKGLGINEQGITEYLNMSHKNNTTGLGYDKNSEIWIEHQEKFNNILQKLNENPNTIQKLEKEDHSLSGQSVELKSKQSHARVHYKKFTYGKDINKYKSKDIANIFGQKELTNKVHMKTKKNDYKKETISVEKNKNEIVTINDSSMTDYFKHKSNYDKRFSSNIINNQATDLEIEEQYAGFGLASKTENTLSDNRVSKDFDEKNNYAFDNPCLGLNSPTEIMLSNTDNTCNKPAKKRKKEYKNDSLHAIEMDKHNARKKLKTEMNGDYKDGFTNPALNLDINFEEDCNGKEFEVSRAQFGLENCGLDLTDEKSDKKCVTFNDHITLYEYDVDSTKKRKGKATLDKFEVENKKQKKKQKQESITTPVSNGFVNEALDIETVCEEINDNKLNEHKSKKTKRRKICKISSLETIQESPEREKEIIEVDIESDDVLDISIPKSGETDVDKKLKKKKKKKETKEINKDKIKRHKKSKKEEIVISKKYKKEKKKDMQDYKVKKYVIQTEISSDQQNIEILDKTNSSEIEILSVVGIEIEQEEKASLENKKKKKKEKSIHNEDCFNEYDIKKEIFDKENVGKEQDLDIKKLKKKDKKCKKSKEKIVSNIEDSIDSNPEIVNGNIEERKIENVESRNYTSLNNNTIIDSINNIMNSPRNAKVRMSKKMLQTLFQNNELLDFPGSNIHDIKGYGIDTEC